MADISIPRTYMHCRIHLQHKVMKSINDYVHIRMVSDIGSHIIMVTVLLMMDQIMTLCRIIEYKKTPRSVFNICRLLKYMWFGRQR